MPFWQNMTLVLMGVIIASVSYLSKGFVFEPLLRYKETLGKTRNRLRFYSNFLTSPGVNVQKSQEAGDVCRELSCELEEKYYTIPCISILIFLHVLPKKEDLRSASGSLIFLYNSTDKEASATENQKHLQNVYKKLHITSN